MPVRFDGSSCEASTVDGGPQLSPARPPSSVYGGTVTGPIPSSTEHVLYCGEHRECSGILARTSRQAGS